MTFTTRTDLKRGLSLSTLLGMLAALLMLSPVTSNAKTPKTPSDAADRWLNDAGAAEADSIADGILKDIGTSGVPSSGNPRDLLKSHIKKRFKDGLKGDIQSADMERVLDAIQEAVNKKKGRNACEKSAISLAWSAIQDKSHRRTLKGARSMWVDAMSGAIGGGTKTATKLVEMTGSKLALEAAKSLLKEIDKRVQAEIAKAGGGVEVYRSNQTHGGCPVSIAVIWNKVAGTYTYLIAGDCACKNNVGAPLSKWSVRGKGRAGWKNGKARGVSAPSVTAKAICCTDAGPTGSSIDPWESHVTVGSGGSTPGQHGTKPPKPIKKTTVEGDHYGNVNIPKVPTGPVCPDEKKKLVADARAADYKADTYWKKANRVYFTLLGDLSDKNSGVTQAMVDAAEQRKNAQKKIAIEARKALNKIKALEVTAPCGNPHSSLWVPGGALAPESGYALHREPEPSYTAADRNAWLANINDMQSALASDAPQSSPHVPYFPAANPGAESEARAIRLGNQLMRQRAAAESDRDDRGRGDDSGRGREAGARTLNIPVSASDGVTQAGSVEVPREVPTERTGPTGAIRDAEALERIERGSEPIRVETGRFGDRFETRSGISGPFQTRNQLNIPVGGFER